MVWGLSVTIETFSPTMAFTNADLPTLGRPTTVTKPLRCWSSTGPAAAASLIPAAANMADNRSTGSLAGSFSSCGSGIGVLAPCTYPSRDRAHS